MIAANYTEFRTALKDFLDFRVQGRDIRFFVQQGLQLASAGFEQGGRFRGGEFRALQGAGQEEDAVEPALGIGFFLHQRGQLIGGQSQAQGGRAGGQYRRAALAELRSLADTRNLAGGAALLGTAMLLEVARRKGSYVPDVSFGTHFFQDLVESRIHYLPLYPDDPGVMDTLGLVYLKKGLVDSAIRELEDSATQLADNPTVRYHLGLAYHLQGRSDLARRELQAALALNKSFPEKNDVTQLLGEL